MGCGVVRAHQGETATMGGRCGHSARRGLCMQAAHKVDGADGVPAWRPDAYLTVTGDSIASDGIYLLENAADVRTPAFCCFRGVYDAKRERMDACVRP